MDEDDRILSPPPGPPPLLGENQLIQLARQGWLTLDLPHDLTNTITKLFEKSHSFFDLPDQDKAELYPAKSGTEFGFYPVINEKEYVTYRCRIHTESDPARAEAQELETTVAEAWKQCATLLFRILCDLARWSDLDISVWNDILDGTLTMPENEQQMTYSLLRVFRYFASTGFAEKHSDLGLLTICIGDRKGLEVLDRLQSTKEKHVWFSPEAGPTTATILVGITLAALSNNTFNTGSHQVVGNQYGRASAVFALRHSPRHPIDFRPFGGQGEVTPSELWDIVQDGRVNINSVKERREEQRAEFAARKLAEKKPVERTPKRFLECSVA